MVAPVFDSEQTLSNARKNGVIKQEVHLIHIGWNCLNSIPAQDNGQITKLKTPVSPRWVSEDYQTAEDTMRERDGYMYG